MLDFVGLAMADVPVAISELPESSKMENPRGGFVNLLANPM